MYPIRGKTKGSAIVPETGAEAMLLKMTPRGESSSMTGIET